MNKLENVTRGITSTISNPMYVSYSLLGISSLILGYYTFFDDKIDELVEQPVEQPVEQQVEQSVEQPVEQSVEQEPIQEPFEQEPEQTQFQGGKKNKTSGNARSGTFGSLSGSAQSGTFGSIKRTKHRKNKRTIKH